MAVAFKRFFLVLVAAPVLAVEGNAQEAPLPITTPEHDKSSDCAARAVAEDTALDSYVELLQQRGGLARAAAAADDALVDRIIKLFQTEGSDTGLATDKAAVDEIMSLFEKQGGSLEKRREIIQRVLKSDVDLNRLRGLFPTFDVSLLGKKIRTDYVVVARQQNGCAYDAASVTSFTMNPGDDQNDCYMILGQLTWPSWRQADGAFLFKAVWSYSDGSKKTLIWTQTSPPTDDAPATDFKPLNAGARAAADFEEQFGATAGCQSFNGLRKSLRTNACVVSGSNANCFFNCFGQLEPNYSENLPNGTTLSGIIGPELTGAVGAVLYIAPVAAPLALAR